MPQGRRGASMRMWTRCQLREEPRPCGAPDVLQTLYYADYLILDQSEKVEGIAPAAAASRRIPRAGPIPHNVLTLGEKSRFPIPRLTVTWFPSSTSRKEVIQCLIVFSPA